MKNAFSILRARGVAVKSAVAVLATVAATSAHAALPAWATAIVTAGTDAVTDTSTAIGPVIALSVGAVLVIRLIKRFANKI